MKRLWIIIASVLGCLLLGLTTPVQSLVFEGLIKTQDSLSRLAGVEDDPNSSFYKLTRLSLEYEGNDFDFYPDESRAVIVNNHSVFRGKDMIKARLHVNALQSYLRVDQWQNCTYNWKLESQNSNVDPERATIGRLRLSGSEFILNCLSGKPTAEAPWNLVPMNKLTFQKTSRSLIIKSHDEDMDQTLYYEKMRPAEIALLLEN